jgi:hypothetical protein
VLSPGGGDLPSYRLAREKVFAHCRTRKASSERSAYSIRQTGLTQQLLVLVMYQQPVRLDLQVSHRY